MSDPFIGEIRPFAFTFAPRGWAECNGQLMPISQNTALFALIGTYYGGDGKSTFALPDLQGSAPMGQGQGPGLSTRFVGEVTGSETVTLLTTEIPAHGHSVTALGPANTNTPAGAAPATAPTVRQYQDEAVGSVALAPNALGMSGGGQPHSNLQPYATVRYCIALQGIFPPRS
ncbi:phage tail protein [Nostocoides sp. F2B08]|uniref:phage tail protein n=1 Tax=Nostocoides sp. F2B08 TaxID=2653936 RepID=UPI001262E8B5|nr:tail fiber protein [Tetrasphaera sp. F2B08]KAB7744118.1 phage tail protein [Tetrasphaera sp. F2B08]